MIDQSVLEHVSVHNNCIIAAIIIILECCAEANAIVSAFRYHADLTASILYTTSEPCPKCAQMIVQSGIRTVVHGTGQLEDTASEIFYRAKTAYL